MALAEMRPGKVKDARVRQAEALEAIVVLLKQLVAKTSTTGVKTSRK